MHHWVTPQGYRLEAKSFGRLILKYYSIILKKMLVNIRIKSRLFSNNHIFSKQIINRPIKKGSKRKNADQN